MPDDGGAIPQGLNRILADCFVLSGAAKMALWRVQSDDQEVRRFLERLVKLLDDTSYKTAVRIRILGGSPAEGFDELIGLASCSRPPAGGSSPHFDYLAQAFVAVARDFHTMGLIARETGDAATTHLLFGKVGRIEEAAWRLVDLATLRADAGSDAEPGAQ
jgi:DNA-binding ferritin-like protein